MYFCVYAAQRRNSQLILISLVSSSLFATTHTTALRKAPLYVPKRSHHMPDWLMIRMLYDGDGLPYKTTSDSARRHIGFSGMGFKFPFVDNADFFDMASKRVRFCTF